jgi:hypothetical protein
LLTNQSTYNRKVTDAIFNGEDNIFIVSIMKRTIEFGALILFALMLAGVVAQPTPVIGVGTTLNQLIPTTPYRIFNDLMKQSAVFVPYQVSTYTWIASRKWGYNLTLGNDLYPTTLATNIYAEADILFFQGIDDSLVNSSY